MSIPRLAALGTATLLLALPAHAELRPLSDSELSQVHAAGLTEQSLQNIASGRPLALAELPPAQWQWREPANTIEQQQALVQLRLGAAVSQGSAGLMQLAAVPALFTPFAPLFLPALAMPLPLFTLPPPKKPDGGS
jgi:hypothetical protein